jgi:TonB family protein
MRTRRARAHARAGRNAAAALGLALAAAAACGTTTQAPQHEEAPARPAPAPRAPLRPAPPGAPATLPTQAARKLLVTDVTKDPYRPRLPARLNQAGASYRGTYRICVSPSGQIDTVRVVSSTGEEALDEEWIQVIRTWRYMPLSINSKRRPFCYVSPVEVSAR